MRELVAEIRRWARSANAGNFSHGSVTLGHEFFICQPNQRVIPVAFEVGSRLFAASARLLLALSAVALVGATSQPLRALEPSPPQLLFTLSDSSPAGVPRPQFSSRRKRSSLR